MTDNIKRKLAAILSADVQGYSRLMGDDEVATIWTLTEYRELMSSIIQEHSGRVVDSPGDNLLAEFSSAVDAVQCAIEVQTELAVRNAELPEDRQMHYRIGINVGDVIVEDERIYRIYGDGVNIAARLESLADGGGICISGTVYDQIENKLDVEFEYQGEQTVKNIAKPIQVYRIHLESVGAETRVRPVSTPEKTSAPLDDPARSYGSLITLAVVAVVILGVGAFALRGWYPLLTSSSFWNPPTLPLPDKPSIAVLPFINMSGDPEQEYFSDGITEDIITDLSKVSGLFVIARNSSFVYKGRAVDVEHVGQALGVRYVLEGSVRRANDRVRINAQLLDATTGGHVWADRYDGEMQDIFALQDQVTQQIVAALQVTLTEGERGQLTHKQTDNLEAYDYYLRGRELYYRATQEMNAQARQMFERAIELDPQYAAAYAMLGFTHWIDGAWYWSSYPQQSFEQMFVAGQKALALDDTLPLAYQLLGYTYVWRDKNYEQAISAAEKAISLDPNNAESYARLATVFTASGHPEEAIRAVEAAIRLNPHYPAFYVSNLGISYYLLGQHQEAILALQRAHTINADYLFAYLVLAAVYSELDRIEEAKAEMRRGIAVNPNFASLDRLRQMFPLKNPAEQERWLNNLRKAGLE